MTELGIDTTGWVRCPSPGCTWLLDPNFPTCPEHPDVVAIPVECEEWIEDGTGRDPNLISSRSCTLYVGHDGPHRDEYSV